MPHVTDCESSQLETPVEAPYVSRHATHAVTFPVALMHALSASVSDAHGSEEAVGVVAGVGLVGNKVGGAVDDVGNDTVVGVGAGATGLLGKDGGVGVPPEQPTKQSDPHMHVSYPSMYHQQLPQLAAQASIWLQMDVVSSPHVVAFVTVSR